jgi:hypothetical protein
MALPARPTVSKDVGLPVLRQAPLITGLAGTRLSASRRWSERNFHPTRPLRAGDWPPQAAAGIIVATVRDRH